MKLPNNYGSVSRLSGNRRRPYVARKTIAYDEDGRQIMQIIGYYASREAALTALANYNQTPTPEPLITLGKVYRAWFAVHSKHVSQSAIDSYKNSLRHLVPILGLPLANVKYRQLQDIIDTMRRKGLSYASCKKVRSLVNMLFDYAIINEWTAQGYGQYLELGKNIPVKPHSVFTRQQINKLWRSSHPFAFLPLLLLYSGMRSVELRTLRRSDVNLKQKYFNIRQSKTKAGIRIIPIHPRILPIVERLAERGTRYLLGDKLLSYGQLAARFNAVMRFEKIKHSTHDCRHTFATLLSNAGANENARRRLLGHAGTNVTDIYTHKALPQLRAAIKLLK